MARLDGLDISYRIPEDIYDPYDLATSWREGQRRIEAISNRLDELVLAENPDLEHWRYALSFSQFGRISVG